MRTLAFLLFAYCAMISSAHAVGGMLDCAMQAASIRIGMTRADIETRMQYDGGVTGVFKGERLFFNGLKAGEKPSREYWSQKFCMLTIDFRPQGMSDTIYNDLDLFAKWIAEKKLSTDKTDIAVKISAPFIGNYHMG